MIDLWACWDLPRDLRRSTTVQSLLAAPALRRRYRIGPDLWRARLLLPVPERPRRLALGAWRYRIGAVGRPALGRFYSTEFLPPLPGDLPASRDPGLPAASLSVPPRRQSQRARFRRLRPVFRWCQAARPRCRTADAGLGGRPSRAG